MMPQKPHLVLVDTGSFTNRSAELQASADERLLIAEAKAFEARCGHNVYSNFLLKNLARPSREQAETIGRLIGVRVKAADGSLQPRPTTGEMKAIKIARARRNERIKFTEEASRLKSAITDIVNLTISPVELIFHSNPAALAEGFQNQLDEAISRLMLLKEEHSHRGKNCAK